jgi:hypothetical protein
VYIGLRAKYPSLSDFNKAGIFSTNIRKKNTQICNLMKIRPVGAESFDVNEWTDGRTDRHNEVNSRFSQFCERAYRLKFNIFVLKFDERRGKWKVQYSTY